jgi:peptide/nickel transport system substrate-binding protein
MLAAQNVLQAIYDGPIDNAGFSYQPVILEKLPSLGDGATIQPVAVKENDLVVNEAGEVVLLKLGQVVRPYGCYSSDCAITWQGEVLEMVQMSANFRLKEGLRWSDGEPLTANDSLFSYEKARSCRSPWDATASCGTLGAGGGETMRRTASYKALDELTTQWTGIPGFIDQTYMTNFAHPLPRHQLEGFSAGELFEADQSRIQPMGWGPYVIEKWKPGEYIQLRKNPYYFRGNEGLPYFDELIIRFFAKDGEATLSALQNGECDLIDYEQSSKNIPLKRLLEAGKNGQIEALTSPNSMWEHLDFNLQPSGSIRNTGSFAGWDLDGDGQGPFGDVRLRQAIAMCLDRQKVIDSLFFGQSLVPDTYLPPNHPLFNTQATHWPYDPLAAGKLLDEIGWLDTDGDLATPRLARGVTGVPDGTLLEFNYETTQADIRQQTFEILAQSLATCGIQANLKTHPAEEFFKAETAGILYGRNYDLTQFAWLTSTIPPCDLYLSTRIPSPDNNWSGQNTVGFVDLTYDAACASQLQFIFNEPGYARTVHEAQHIFAEQLPVVPLYMRIKYAAARPDMCGYSMNPTASSDFWNIEAFNYGDGCR